MTRIKAHLKRIDHWIEKQLSHPGIDPKTLTQKKNYLVGNFTMLFPVLGLTISLWVFVPDLKVLIIYGVAIIALSLFNVLKLFYTHRYLEEQVFISNSLYILITFACILKLGGIPYSGGLIFVGLSSILYTLNLQKVTYAVWLFFLYLLTIILAGILHPWLSVPAAMTTTVNVTLYVINTLWISAFFLSYITKLIRQVSEYEQRETNRFKELDEMKTKLFTNITHEFRTPLTIILGMANLIKTKPDEWIDEGVEKITHSGRNLLHLVNQMLDLSKLAAGAMSKNLLQQDVMQILRYLTESFSSLAISKNIDLKFKPETECLVMDLDQEKLFHIVSNLVSNALKYTQEGGMVELSAGLSAKGNREFIIRVQDNGPGIEAAHLPHIFDRFFRVEGNHSGDQSGSGLGLALTRELVKLLGGTIEADSTPGSGTVFTVSLPVTNTAPPKENFDPPEIKKSFPDQYTKTGTSPGIKEKSGKKKEDRPILLIVEDNLDLVNYLKAILGHDYYIEIAIDGREGMQKALELVPDIVLSDVMMPVMDGITMLDKVKNDMRTSHIPVVMLTAKADIASRLEGLERGADDYLAKPFNEAELRIRLKTLIDLRRKLQERYTSMEKLPVSEDQANHFEDSFMQKVREIMEGNLDDDQFGIVQLSKAVGMSRAQLYRKFKSLTDKTVNDYLRSFRLHKARELLLATDLNVSEVAYETGFKNLSHFSRVFTEEFGENPSELKN